MNLRTISLTVAVLAAACLAIWFLQRPAEPAATDARVGNAMLAADLATRAAQISLTDSGKSVTLVRQAGGNWHVATYHDLPADFAKLGQLINDLTEAKIQRFVTARPDRLARLEFKDATITLLDSDAKELWSVTLGKNADGGGRFVRYGKEEKGYQTGAYLALETESKNWADTALLNLKQDEIAAVEIGFADGTTIAAKRAKKEESWAAENAPAGKRLKADRITSALGNLVALRFSDTTAPDDPAVAIAKAHSRTLKLTTFGGDTYTVNLARKPEEKKPKPVVSTGGSTSEAGAASHATATNDTSGTTPLPAKTAEPEFETIPPGPVYAVVTCSNEKAPINDLMKRRAFQTGEWTFTALPANAADLWEDVPAMPPAAKSTDSGSSERSPAKAP